MRLIGLAVALAVSLTLAPLAAEAQPSTKSYRIGYLSAADPLDVDEPFRRALRELGYSERQIVVETRVAVGDAARLGGIPPNLASAFHYASSKPRPERWAFVSLEVHAQKDLKSAIERAKRGRAEALIVLRDPTTLLGRTTLVKLADEYRIPTMYWDERFAVIGGLLAYGPSAYELHRRAAVYVDKILKGTKPADLPVEQPTKFELVINRKTAKALGLTIPQSVLGRADQVIE